MANYVFNSSSSGDTYNAKCLNVSDDSEWTPSVAEYPQDGTIDLSGGTSGRYLDTQWTAPQNTEWTMSGIYNVVMGVSYDMYSIHYKTGDLCDIYLGSNTVPLALSEEDKPYTPPTGNWIIEEEPPAIIFPITEVRLETNGDFTTDTDWIAGAGITWSATNGGRYDFNVATNIALYQTMTPSLSTGIRYSKEFEISEYVSGIASSVIGGQNEPLGGFGSNGIFTEYATVPSDGQKTFGIYGSAGDGLVASIEYVKATEAYDSGDLSEVYMSSRAGCSTYIDHKDGTFTVKVPAGAGLATPQIAFNLANVLDGLNVDYTFQVDVVSGDGGFYGYSPVTGSGWTTSYNGGLENLTGIVAAGQQAKVAFDCSSATVETEFLVSNVTMVEV